MAALVYVFVSFGNSARGKGGWRFVSNMHCKPNDFDHTVLIIQCFTISLFVSCIIELNLTSCLFLIHMNSVWIYVVSCVHWAGRCPSVQPASFCLSITPAGHQSIHHPYLEKTLMLDIRHKLFNQILSYIPFLAPAMIIDTINIYTIYNGWLDTRVSGKQNRMTSFSHTFQQIG